MTTTLETVSQLYGMEISIDRNKILMTRLNNNNKKTTQTNQIKNKWKNDRTSEQL